MLEADKAKKEMGGAETIVVLTGVRWGGLSRRSLERMTLNKGNGRTFSRQGCEVPWKAPGHSGQGPHWAGHNVPLHRAAEQGVFD